MRRRVGKEWVDEGPASRFGSISMRPTIGGLCTLEQGQTWLTLNHTPRARQYFQARQRARTGPQPTSEYECEQCGKAFQAAKPAITCSYVCRKRRQRRLRRAA